MLKYMLDTNICIYLMKDQPDFLVEKFAHLRRGEVAISAITLGELYCGLGRHDSAERMAALLDKLDSLPFDTRAAAVFGDLYRRFPGKRGSFDRMIAAHAIAAGVTLVTNDTTDFTIYVEAGLRVENWAARDQMT